MSVLETATTTALLEESKKVKRELQKVRDQYIETKKKMRLLEARAYTIQDELDRRGR